MSGYHAAQSELPAFSAREPGLKARLIGTESLDDPATAGAAPDGADLKAATTQKAQTLDGVLRDCPASFAGIGLPEKRCVGLENGVKDARPKLNTALPKEL